jgi:hypothetical protein
MDIDKLEQLFRDKYEKLVSAAENSDEIYESWISYCDKHKVFLLHPEWMRESLNEGMKGRICIHTPEEDRNASPWLLVPKKFAERALILGFLP